MTLSSQISNNLNIIFSDFAVNTAEDFEGACEPGDFAISGLFQPIDLLTNLNGETIAGEWILSIEDAVDDDGGILLEWSISTCSSGELEPAIVINNNEENTSNFYEVTSMPSLNELGGIDFAFRRQGALSFSLNGKGYYGLGIIQFDENTKQYLNDVYAFIPF